MKNLTILSLLTLTVICGLAQPVTYPSSFTVAQDGSAPFRTIQDAVNAVRDLSQQRVTIHIKNGVYHEKLVIPSWKTMISLVGESRDSTIISYDDYSGKSNAGGKDAYGKDKFTTYTSYTMLVAGNDFTAENLTIENTAGRVGQATVVFSRCEIRSLINSYLTAAATTPRQAYGFVFLDCRLTADTAAKKVWLGRPWRPYARTVYIRTAMGDQIVPAGWDNWRNPENEKTAYYGEYESKGEGARAAARVGWSRQLTDREARQYSAEAVLGEWVRNYL